MPHLTPVSSYAYRDNLMRPEFRVCFPELCDPDFTAKVWPNNSTAYMGSCPWHCTGKTVVRSLLCLRLGDGLRLRASTLNLKPGHPTPQDTLYPKIKRMSAMLSAEPLKAIRYVLADEARTRRHRSLPSSPSSTMAGSSQLAAIVA